MKIEFIHKKDEEAIGKFCNTKTRKNKELMVNLQLWLQLNFQFTRNKNFSLTFQEPTL